MLSLIDPYCKTWTLYTHKHINAHRLRRTQRLTSLAAVIIESTQKCGETRSKNTFSTHKHRHTPGLHTTQSKIDFAFKTARNNQETIYYSALEQRDSG